METIFDLSIILFAATVAAGIVYFILYQMVKDNTYVVESSMPTNPYDDEYIGLYTAIEKAENESELITLVKKVFRFQEKYLVKHGENVGLQTDVTKLSNMLQDQEQRLMTEQLSPSLL